MSYRLFDIAESPSSGINVLSLFDGISVAQQALKELQIPVKNYYASEKDIYAVKVCMRNHPNTVQLGAVQGVKTESLKKINLLIGGSPCQDLSISKRNREGLKGKRSKLFYYYAAIRDEIKPDYFVMENVASMKNSDRDVISEMLGVEPVLMDSALLGAQSRKRYYWTNIPGITTPEDRGISLKDIIESGYTERRKSLLYTATYARARAEEYFEKSNRQMIFNKPVRVGIINKGGQGNRVYHIDGKSICLSANGGGQGAKTGLYEIKGYVRRLSVKECEKLQNLPIDYTNGISESQAYKCLGNAFDCAAVKHILSFADFEKLYKQVI